jgi:hypothetical protein
MSNTATEECSLENAILIQMAFYLANFDMARAGRTPQAQQAAQQLLDSVRARVPQACSDEMAASFSDASLSQYCSPLIGTAWATFLQSSMLTNANYIATGNREAFIDAVGTAVGQYLRSIPRRCWFAPQPQRQTQCSLENAVDIQTTHFLVSFDYTSLDFHGSESP